MNLSDLKEQLRACDSEPEQNIRAAGFIRDYEKLALQALESPQIRELTDDDGRTVASCAVFCHEAAALQALEIVRTEHDTLLLQALADEKLNWLIEQLRDSSKEWPPEVLKTFLTHENSDLRQAALLAVGRGTHDESSPDRDPEDATRPPSREQARSR